MLTPPIRGRCLCGATTYEADTKPVWQAHCHCESCRRATGAAFASFFCIKDGHWRWTGAKPATYESSARVWRDRCATCGAPMAYRADRYAGEIHFLAATLNDPSAFAPTAHVNTAEQLPWAHLGDGLKRK